jgi:RimJ/RimL family protein N-acetyltransferase
LSRAPIEFPVEGLTGNTISQRVAKRAGFSREGLLRSHALIKGRRRDMIVFSLLTDDSSQSGGRR